MDVVWSHVGRPRQSITAQKAKTIFVLLFTASCFSGGGLLRASTGAIIEVHARDNVPALEKVAYVAVGKKSQDGQEQIWHDSLPDLVDKFRAALELSSM